MKKIFFSLLAFCALSASAQRILVGDMNGDGVLSIEDVTLLTSTILGERDVIIHKCYADDNDFTTKSFTVNGVTFKMIPVEHGTFEMGLSADGNNVTPVHTVTISKDYYIGQTEVTQGLWCAVMGQKPHEDDERYQWKSMYGLGDNYPAYYISWIDCQSFITKLNELTGQNFRMPTEAEWEFAAKGGNKSQGYIYSGSNNIEDVAWYAGNSGKMGVADPNYGSHPVASKSPNELGIYDMSGNVSEWCNDEYASYSSEAVTDPTGTSSYSNRIARAGSAGGINCVERNGSWDADAKVCNNVSRSSLDQNFDFFKSIGFRLALTAPDMNSNNDDNDSGNQEDGEQNHEYVDLGLPSGTLWATCNVGADNPEDYGYYFAWGEVEPKSTYSWSTYFDSVNGSSSNFKKYYNNGGKTELDLEEDAAYMNWGEGWRMPSDAQLTELRTNCTWTWDSTKKGYIVVGPNKSSLFLPAAGYYGDNSLDSAGAYGYYCSRSLYASYSYNAFSVSFYSGYVYRNYAYRYYGLSVRPVRQN